MSDRTRTLKVGDKAPDFELPATGAKDRIGLKDYAGKKNVVVLFYPADWSSVCSREIPGFGEVSSEFQNLGAQILGISVDNLFSHNAWIESHPGITYPLLSDFWPHGEVAKRYGLFLEDKGLCERAVLVIDKEGVIQHIKVYPLEAVPDPKKTLQACSVMK